MKHINELTIEEYQKFTEYISDEIPDIYSVMELLGEKPAQMKFDIFQNKWAEILNMTLSTKGVKKIYNINGRLFKASLNPLKLKAGQYIDFQTYVQDKDFKIQNVLSVFLIPTKKNIFGKYNTKKYNTDYDIFEVQDYLYKNMLIAEANELSNFFLSWSIKLMRVMKDFSEKKLVKNKLKLIQQKKTRLFG